MEGEKEIVALFCIPLGITKELKDERFIQLNDFKEPVQTNKIFFLKNAKRIYIQAICRGYELNTFTGNI